MQSMLLQQYQYIVSARRALMIYCTQLSVTELNQPVKEFSNSSIQYLLVHVADTYLYWLVNIGLRQACSYFSESKVDNIDALREMFIQIDDRVNIFLEKYKETLQLPAAFDIPGKNISLDLTPLQLFTHVTTHEFHHKGQILTMSRLLGYIPVDTDVIRLSAE